MKPLTSRDFAGSLPLVPERTVTRAGRGRGRSRIESWVGLMLALGLLGAIGLAVAPSSPVAAELRR